VDFDTDWCMNRRKEGKWIYDITRKHRIAWHSIARRCWLADRQAFLRVSLKMGWNFMSGGVAFPGVGNLSY
jgi:hypothetical protein